MGDAEVVDMPVGHDVVLRTTLGEEFTSTILAFDKATNCLLLREVGSHAGVCNVRFLKANFIKEVVSVTKPKGPVEMKLPCVDLDRCRKREEKALQQAAFEASRVGVGVTKEAQSIFEALSKTMPCRWVDKTIVILDCVYVKEPYTVDSVSGDEGHRTTLERVQKVLAAERSRLALRSDS